MVLFLHLSEHQEAENSVGWYFFKPHFFFMNFTCFCVSYSKMAPTRQSPQNLSYWLMHLFFLFPFLWFCIKKTQRTTHPAMTDFLKDRMIHRNTILFECQEGGNGWELCCVIIFVLSQLNERVMKPGQRLVGVLGCRDPWNVPKIVLSKTTRCCEKNVPVKKGKVHTHY